MQQIQHPHQLPAGQLPAQLQGILVRGHSGEHWNAAVSRSLHNQQIPGHAGKLIQHGAQVLALGIEPVEQFQGIAGIVGGDITHHFPAGLLPRHAQAGIHPLGGQFSHGGGGALIQKAQAVPQSAVSQTGQHPGGAVVQVNALLVSHILQPGGDILLADPPERKPLAPGQNGGRDLMQLCGGQDEQQMLRRLLDDFQQGIEGRNGEHMNLVDDIHPHFHLGGGIDGVVPEVPDVIHAIVGGSIDFQHVHAGAGIDGPAGLAAVAGVAVIRVQAIHRFGQNLGAAGFAGSPGTGEQVGVAHFPRHQLMLQGLGHRLLTGHIVEGLRTILAI